MSITIAFGVVAGALVIVTLELVRRQSLKERFAALWVGFAALVAVGVIFPNSVARLSEILGFEVPANMVLVAGILLLAFVCVQLSIEVTRLRDMMERVANRQAVLEAEDHSNDPPDG